MRKKQQERRSEGKQKRALKLSKETLQALVEPQLRPVGGGASETVCGRTIKCCN